MNKNLGPLDLLIFQSTSFCNLDCKYCYLPNRALNSKIDIEIIERTLNNVIESGIIKDSFSIVWHAGEPMVIGVDFYRKVNDLIKKIIPKNITVNQHIQTNATLINDEWCDFFKESNMRVGISVDGPQHINDRNRLDLKKRGTFDRVIKGIQYLEKHSIEYSAIAVLTNYSLSYPNEIYDFFASLKGLRSVGFNVDEEDGININSTITEDQKSKLKEFWERIYELQMIEENYIHVREIFGFNEFFLRTDFNRKKLLSNHMLQPLGIITVDTNGDFTTFSPELIGMDDKTYDDFNFGNINHNLFKDIGKNEKFQRVFNEIVQGIKKCKIECKYYQFCGGGAPSNKLYENGSFNSTETNFCKFTKQVQVDAFLDVLERNLSH